MNQNNDNTLARTSAQRHNVYSGYFPSKHNTLCSPTQWDDRRVAATLSAERNENLRDSLFSHALCVLIGAALVLAYLT